MKDMDDIRRFISMWNIRFPVDRWWRAKHKIAFNSPAHRESNFLDQLIEYEEDKMYNRVDKEDEYEPGTGMIFKKPDEINMSASDLVNMAKSEMDNYMKEFPDMNK